MIKLIIIKVGFFIKIVSKFVVMNGVFYEIEYMVLRGWVIDMMWIIFN